ncbi:MAG TPA: hypothetical protein VFA55_08550, partial [Candidatus Kapabacteria bacterium]|nr:hypothetical protein [Candidatus Kapabacteria bacterium]
MVKIDGKGNIQWEKSLGGSEYDNGFSIFQTSDGGYIVGGDAEGTDGDVTGNHGGSDLWVVKLDSLGHIQWEKCYGGTNIENGCFIKPAKDGGYILAGESNSLDGEVTGLHGNGLSIDIWVVKIDSIGNLQWEKCYGGTYDDFGEDIIPTSDGGYIVAGVSNSKDDGDVTGHHGGNNNIPDYWIVKIDSIGKIQWEKSLGGSDFDMAQKILQTADGGYIVVGYSQSIDGDVTGNHGGKDYWIIKLDANGNIQWEKSYGGTGDDWAISISLTNDGGYVVAGESNSNDGDVTGNHGGSNDCWIIKLDSVGTLQWQKCYGGTGGDVAVSISPTSDNGYIFLGYTNSNDGDVTGNHSSNQNVDYWVVKLGPVNAALIAAQSALFDTLGCDSIELSTVQIKNTGIDTLHIDSVVITQDNEGFSLVPALVVPFVIPPGRDTTITIQFAPATPGAKTAVLVIKSDANNTPVLTLDLSGQKNPS